MQIIGQSRKTFVKTLFLFLFISSSSNAQVDSFRIGNSNLRFNIPYNWIVQEKTDGLQNDTSWNVVFQYGAGNEKMFSNLAVKIEKREQENTPPPKFKKQQQVISDFIKCGKFKGAYIAVTDPDPVHHQSKYLVRKYYRLEVYYLNEDLSLTFLQYTRGTIAMIDSFKSYFSDFRNSFFETNSQTLLSYSLLINTGKNTATKSVLMLNKSYSFDYDSSWILMPYQSSFSFGTGFQLERKFNNGRYVLVTADITPSNRDFITRSADQNTLEKGGKRSTQLNPQSQDTTFHFITKQPNTLTDKSPSLRSGNRSFSLTPSSVDTLPNFIKTQPAGLNLKPDYYGPSIAGMEIVFGEIINDTSYLKISFSISFSNPQHDELLQDVYSRGLEAFIQSFIEENHIKGRYYMYASPVTN